MTTPKAEAMAKLSCVSEQGQNGLLWTVFGGEPFCSPRIASFAKADDARKYLTLLSAEKERDELKRTLDGVTANIRS